MGKRTHLMWHCTATPDIMDVRRSHIEKWHLQERGWSRVGYTGLVMRSGVLDIMIPHDKDDDIDRWELSNGAKGWNGKATHYCYAGGTDAYRSPKDNRTAEQLITMATITKMYVMLYPDIKIIGHNQVANKGCPSFLVDVWCQQIGIPEKNIDRKIYH